MARISLPPYVLEVEAIKESLMAYDYENNSGATEFDLILDTYSPAGQRGYILYFQQSADLTGDAVCLNVAIAWWTEFTDREQKLGVYYGTEDAFLPRAGNAVDPLFFDPHQFKEFGLGDATKIKNTVIDFVRLAQLAFKVYLGTATAYEKTKAAPILDLFPTREYPSVTSLSAGKKTAYR